MMRRRAVMRRGPGLVGTVATASQRFCAKTLQGCHRFPLLWSALKAAEEM